MKKIITANYLNDGNSIIQLNIEIPRTCPQCTVSYANEPIASYYIVKDDLFEEIPQLYSLFFCPNCENCFLVQYDIDEESDYRNLNSAFIKYVYPIQEEQQSFSKEISQLSPRFIEIYHQSEYAENHKLDQICGMGYRKALEILVKDFTIHENPEKRDAILKMPLNKCIENYIEDTNIKTLAQRSAWIGNDETHYLRKQDGRDISDMKKFILATVYFINMLLITKDAASIKPK